MNGHLSWNHHRLVNEHGLAVGRIRKTNSGKWKAVLFKAPTARQFGDYKTSLTLSDKQEAKAWLIATHRLLG